MIISSKTQLIFEAPGLNRQPSSSPKRIFLQKPMLCITARFQLLRSDVFVTQEHFIGPSGHMALGMSCPRSLFGNWLLAYIAGFLEARICVHTWVVPGARGFLEEMSSPGTSFGRELHFGEVPSQGLCQKTVSLQGRHSSSVAQCLLRRNQAHSSGVLCLTLRL